MRLTIYNTAKASTLITVLLIVRDLCCSSFVKDAAEDLMDQYGAAAGAGAGGEGVGGSHCEKVSL